MRTTTSILRDIFLPFIFVDNSNYNVNIVMSLYINKYELPAVLQKMAVLFIFNSLKRIFGPIFFPMKNTNKYWNFCEKINIYLLFNVLITYHFQFCDKHKLIYRCFCCKNGSFLQF